MRTLAAALTVAALAQLTSLRVAVATMRDGKIQRRASQWVDFEVVAAVEH